MKKNLTIGIIIGVTLILLSIIFGLITENDIAFVFAGIGVIIIGISFLIYINKKYKESNEETHN